MLVDVLGRDRARVLGVSGRLSRSRIHDSCATESLRLMCAMQLTDVATGEWA